MTHTVRALLLTLLLSFVHSAEAKTVYWFCFADEYGTKNAYFTPLFTGNDGYSFQEKLGAAWQGSINKTTHGFAGGGCEFGPGTSAEGSRQEAEIKLNYRISSEQRYGRSILRVPWTYNGD